MASRYCGFSDPDGLEVLSGTRQAGYRGIPMSVPMIRILETFEEVSIYERNNQEERLP